jgi:hypothetical protein
LDSAGVNSMAGGFRPGIMRSLLFKVPALSLPYYSTDLSPRVLDNAHRKLDAAVFAAYGWPSDLSDDEILARLLALNLERSGA